MKLRKFLAAATALTLLLGAAATPEVGSEIKLALTAHAESGEIPIDEAHFPDEIFRQSILSELDTDKNGCLSTEEAAVATSLHCDSKDLTSLKGIEYFTELISLDCSNNQLTELDLSGNAKLEILNCSNNQITTLDLSNNTEIWSLDCCHNQLTSLNIKNNTALVGLVCELNQLTSLDVSSNTELKTLNCWGNNISSIDISNNLFLVLAFLDTKIENSDYVDYFFDEYYYNYELTDDGISYSFGFLVDQSTNINAGIERDFQLDISADNFPDDNFRTYISENIDDDKNGKLSAKEIYDSSHFYLSDSEIGSLEGIGYFTSLTYLDCSNNQLDSLDVSKNTKLMFLYCNDNLLTTLDVSNNTALTDLNCGTNKLSSLDVSNNTKLNTLYCWTNQIISLDVSNNTELEDLDCMANQITSLDVTNNTSLTYLDCSINKLSSLDVSMNTELAYLGCHNNEITSLDLSNNAALKDLVCSFNKLTKLDISNNTALTYFACYKNNITSLDTSKNTVLEYLECGNNQLTSLDLGENDVLISLSCNINKLSSLDISGCSALMDLSCDDNQLTTLDISNNPNLLTVYSEDSYEDGDIIVYSSFDESQELRMVVDNSVSIITSNENHDTSTADVPGMENISDVDITDMGITFEDENGETYTAEVQADGTIMLPALPAGVYTVTASLENCPSRDYEVTVEEGKPVKLDVELKLYGDIDGSGYLSSADLSQINEHVQGTRELKEEYDEKVADVSGDGRVTSADLSKINEHIQQLKLMW